MKNHSAKALCGDFLDAHLEYASEELPIIHHFCDNKEDANMCLELVLSEYKGATSHSLLGLQLRNEPLPKMGDLLIVTDWEGVAKCIVQTQQVRMVPFFSITAAYGQLEG